MALPSTFTKEDSTSSLPSRYTMTCLKESGQKVKIRVLSDFIEGKSVFGEKDGKPFPYRFKIGQQIPVKCIGINRFNNEPNKVKRFIAAVAYNYANKQIEIFECDKSGILNSLFDLEHDEDWGDLKGYDVTIARSGEGKDTRYSVLPSNKSPLTSEIQTIFMKTPVNLEALYVGKNPFDTKEKGSLPSSQESDFITDPEDIKDEIPF